jgi:hypothetical protein
LSVSLIDLKIRLLAPVLFTSFPGTNANVERAYRKGLAMTINRKSYSKPASYV